MSSINDLRRFHPYSQNQANRNKVLQNSNKATNIVQQNNVYKAKPSYTNENYEHKHYLSSIKPNTRNAYPTLMKAGNQDRVLKDRSNRTSTYSNTQALNGAFGDQKKNDSKSLKIWSVTTKSMQEYANRFDTMQKNSINKKNAENTCPENYLFEIIGQLDSTVSTDSNTGSREFSIKDSNGRIHCIFYEIDRTLDRFVRDSWIRCIGKFNTKKKVFQCMKVRLVKNESELFSFGFLVNQTNSFIKSKNFK